MSNGAKVAMAVGAGYLLGRTRKMRLALMLAGAGVTGKFPARATDLVAHGLKSLGTSDQVGNLADQLRGELLGAAKAAALAAATSRVDALNDRIQGLGSGAADATDRASEPLRSVAGRGQSLLSDDQDRYDEDEEDVYEDEDQSSEDGDDYEDAEVVDLEDEEDLETEPEADEDEEPEAQERPRRRAARRRATRQEPAPKSSTRRRAASTKARRAPVRRGR